MQIKSIQIYQSVHDGYCIQNELQNKYYITSNPNLMSILAQQQSFQQFHAIKSIPPELHPTNQVLYEKADGTTFTYYIPMYVQLIFNSVSQISYEDLQGVIHCDLVVTLNVEGFPKEIIEHLKQNIRLFCNINESILLKENKEENEQDEQQLYFDEDKEYYKGKLIQHYITFTLRKQFTASMVAHILWTPFQLLDLIVTISPRVINNFNFSQYTKKKIKQIKELKAKGQYYDEFFYSSWPAEIQQRIQLLKEKKKKLKEIKFKFNLMDSTRPGDAINYEVSRNYGIYNVATSKLRVQYTYKSAPQIILKRADQINQLEHDNEYYENADKKSKIQCFQYAHFIITLYKRPVSAVTTILIPTLLISIINLGIFFQSNLLSSRTGNLANILLAFIAVVPTIRQQIPPGPSLTVIQFAVYALIATNIICFFESVVFRGEDVLPTDIGNHKTFILSCVVTGIIFAFFVIMLIFHKCKWEKEYTDNSKNYLTERFNHKEWRNIKCDEKFKDFITEEKIIPRILQ